MQRGVYQQQQATPAPIERQYFSQQNEVNLYNTLLMDFQQRQGGLTEKQQSRLARALEHYMREVWDVNGPMPLPQLNPLQMIFSPISDEMLVPCPWLPVK
jgi:hypothetical protein